MLYCILFLLFFEINDGLQDERERERDRERGIELFLCCVVFVLYLCCICLLVGCSNARMSGGAAWRVKKKKARRKLVGMTSPLVVAYSDVDK
jgi:hypothetical protein